LEIYLANAFVSTFAFLQTHLAKQKCKRATKPTHQETAIMDGQQHDRKEARTGNTGLAKVAVQCSADTFVVNQSLVLRINICGKNRHLRQARNRQVVK
jgi:hypothetical protein